VAASIVADAFTASDDGGVETKITEVGCGVSLIGGKLASPHPAKPAIIPMATKERYTVRPNMTNTPLKSGERHACSSILCSIYASSWVIRLTKGRDSNRRWRSQWFREEPQIAHLRTPLPLRCQNVPNSETLMAIFCFAGHGGWFGLRPVRPALPTSPTAAYTGTSSQLKRMRDA